MPASCCVTASHLDGLAHGFHLAPHCRAHSSQVSSVDFLPQLLCLAGRTAAVTRPGRLCGQVPEGHHHALLRRRRLRCWCCQWCCGGWSGDGEGWWPLIKAAGCVGSSLWCCVNTLHAACLLLLLLKVLLVQGLVGGHLGALLRSRGGAGQAAFLGCLDGGTQESCCSVCQGSSVGGQ